MTTTEERLKILKMVEDGKITAEEAAKLLKALSTPRASVTSSGRTARWLRIRVTDTRTGKSKALVQIPFSLVEAGLKIGAHFAPEIEGIDMSLLTEALRSGETGKLVDVYDEEDGEHVEIFVE
jgi:hypothetical protein